MVAVQMRGSLGPRKAHGVNLDAEALRISEGARVSQMNLAEKTKRERLVCLCVNMCVCLCIFGMWCVMCACRCACAGRDIYARMCIMIYACDVCCICEHVICMCVWGGCCMSWIAKGAKW